MEAQEEDVTEEGINYVAMRNLFVREAREALDVKVEKKTRTKYVRESAERLEVNRTVNPIPSLVNGEVHVHFKWSNLSQSLQLLLHQSLTLVSILCYIDGWVGRVPQENEPRQPDAPSRVYCQAPWTNRMGGQDCQAALHRGRMAQTQDCLVRCGPRSLVPTFFESADESWAELRVICLP